MIEIPLGKKYDTNIIDIYVDGGIREGKGYSGVYCKTDDIYYLSLLGGVGHVFSTDMELLSIYNGLEIAERLLMINPYYNIRIHTDLQFLYEILSKKRPLRKRYFDTYKGLDKLINHPICQHFGLDVVFCKISSEDNIAHTVIRPYRNKEIDKEEIVFSSMEMCNKWNNLDTCSGLYEILLENRSLSYNNEDLREIYDY